MNEEKTHELMHKLLQVRIYFILLKNRINRNLCYVII